MTEGMTSRITLPRLAGTREYAAQIAADANIDGNRVVLDFTATESVAQGFCDELVKQLGMYRDIRIVRVLGDNARAHKYVARALRLRHLHPLEATVLVVPDVAVTRAAAESLAESAELVAGDVILDFTHCRSAAQGFCDEIVGQVTGERAGAVTAVTGATDDVQEYVAHALRLRGLPMAQGILNA